MASRGLQKTVRKRRPPAHKMDKELARTWLVTVINPIIEGLRREKTWLARGRWTWDTDTGRFAHLWPAAAYVEARYRDNFDAFLKQYPEARDSFARHDSALLRLARACEEAVAALLTSNVFATALEHANRLAGQANVSADEARGAVPAERWPKHLAEYVVNNVESLPSHYTSAEFWRIVAPVLLETRTSDPLRALFEKIKQRGQSLLRQVERSIDVLLDIRAQYTRHFSLPPVPLLGSAES